MNHEHWDHIYLSPHLDDAALSCGGLIATQTVRGERVLVVTLFTAGLEPGNLPSHLRRMPAAWGCSGIDPFAIRRSEDSTALPRLGADYRHVGWQGALYRRGENGRFLYRGLNYFGPIAQGDAGLQARIMHLLQDLRRDHPDAMFYAPLGIGVHVDHALVYAAARRLAGPICFYEDMPYVLLGNIAPPILRLLAALSDRLPAARGYSGGQIAPPVARLQSRPGLHSGPRLTLVASRIAQGERWLASLYAINLAAKVDAVLDYRSQPHAFWDRKPGPPRPGPLCRPPRAGRRRPVGAPVAARPRPEPLTQAPAPAHSTRRLRIGRVDTAFPSGNRVHPSNPC
jgi:LmbE family N-acetylglucosaminyl deacetylase